MPVAIPLKFVPPDQEDLVSLHIYESADPAGTFNEIEVVTEIGTYPSYIDNYTTDQATALDYWFALAWEDDKGAVTELTQPVQGGVETLVGELIDRAALISPTIDKRILQHAAEYAVTTVMGVSDPYDPTLTAAYRQLQGMTFLVLAQAQIAQMAMGSSSSGYTAGLVSQKSDSGSSSGRDQIEWLIKQANGILGLSVSYVMLLDEIDVTGLGVQSSISYDQSRLALTVNFE